MLSEEDKDNILTIFNKNQNQIVITTDENYEEDVNGNGVNTFIVECDNSNPMYIGSIKSDLTSYCEPRDIGFDTDSNDNGFYGKNYIFYKYLKDELTETIGDEKEYEFVIFENTACRQRRPTNPGEAEEDITEGTFMAKDDLEAMQLIIKELGYNEEDIKEYYSDVESCVDFFKQADWSDGSPFAIYIKCGNRFVYDSGSTIQDFIDEYDDCSFEDEEDEDADDDWDRISNNLKIHKQWKH